MIIGPGSMIIYAFIGAIKFLSDSGHLDDLSEISCSSAGAIIGLFYVFYKGDMNKLLKISVDAPLVDLAKPDIKSLLTKFGLIDADRFEKYMVKTLGGVNPTFKELYEKNPIKLHIPTYDLVTNRTIYMSVDTTPDMKVAHAVRRSIAIPLIMTPVQSRYIDGSMYEQSPFVPFLGKSDVLEIRFRFYPSPTQKPRTFFQFMYHVVMTMLSHRLEYCGFQRLDVYTSPEFELFNFSMSLEQKLQMYKDGYYQAQRSLPVYYHNSRDPSEEDSKNPASTHSQCTRDQEPRSEDLHHLVDDVIAEMIDHCLGSQSQDLPETYRSDGDTSFSSSHSDVDS